MARLRALAVGAVLVAGGAGCGGDALAGKQPRQAGPPPGVTEPCATRSGADFPGAYSDPGNVVVGPLVLVGLGALTPVTTIGEFGGNKVAALVENGHRATVAVRGRGVSLGYGPLPQGEVGLRDGHRAVTFVACRGREGNSAGDRRITFWMGFLMTTKPRCVRLRVWIDEERSARRIRVPFGRECPE